MKKILIFSFILILVGYGCKKTVVNDADLLKVKWVLSYIQDTKTNAIRNYPGDAARKISIDFTDSLNVISFSGICNGGSGTYSFSTTNGTIMIKGLATTQIGCQFVEWEEYTIQNLYHAFRYKIIGNNMVIYSNGSYNLYFSKD
jgi:heat shock protein HslJ